MDKEFIQLVAHHEGILHKVSHLYCRSEEDRKDLFQDILLQLWLSYPRFRAEAKITTWMYRVAINTAISRVRKKKQVFAPLDEKSYQIPSGESRDEEAGYLLKAIGHLNEVQKAIIMLHLEECSYQEIADIIGISISNVGYKLHEIKKKLRQTLIQHGFKQP